MDRSLLRSRRRFFHSAPFRSSKSARAALLSRIHSYFYPRSSSQSTSALLPSLTLFVSFRFIMFISSSTISICSYMSMIFLLSSSVSSTTICRMNSTLTHLSFSPPTWWIQTKCRIVFSINQSDWTCSLLTIGRFEQRSFHASAVRRSTAKKRRRCSM